MMEMTQTPVDKSDTAFFRFMRVAGSRAYTYLFGGSRILYAHPIV